MIVNPHTPPQSPRKAPVIAGPWPCYAGVQDLPECERWVLYESAKDYRKSLESQGFTMTEQYDDFVRRVTRELDI